VRPLGAARLVAIVFIVFSVVFVWGPAHMFLGFLHEMSGSKQKGFEYMFGGMMAVFIILGFIPAGIGLLLAFGRTRIEWKNGRLISSEVIGPFRWGRRFPRKPIRTLQVSAAKSEDGRPVPKQFERFSGITVFFEDGSKKILILGYPKEWMLAIAQELKTYVGGSFSALNQVSVVDATLPEADPTEVPSQPPGSRIKVEERINGLMLFVPPAGLWRGSSGLFFFALLWCGFMAVFTTLMFSAGLKGAVWAPLGFLAIFWAVGFGLMAYAIKMGRSSATLTVEGGQLLIALKSPFGIKQWQWNRAEIADIRAEASGMKSNERPVINLQIHPITGKKTGVLAGHDPEELRWIAARLRQALNVPVR